MAQSVHGYESVPHPSSKEVWEVEVDPAEGEAGTIDIIIGVAGVDTSVTGVEFDAAAADVQDGFEALEGPLAGAVVTGGPLGTDPISIEFPIGPVKLSVDGTDLTEEESSVSAEKISAGRNTVGNITIANPTGAERIPITQARPRSNPDYTGRHTPSAEYKNPDGSSITAGGGVPRPT